MFDRFEFDEKFFFKFPFEIPAIKCQISFQEPATPVMSGLLDLHDYVFFFIIVVLSVVFSLIFQVVSTFSINTNKGKEFAFFHSSYSFLNLQFGDFLLKILRSLCYFFFSFFFWFWLVLRSIFFLRSGDLVRTWFLSDRRKYFVEARSSVIFSIAAFPFFFKSSSRSSNSIFSLCRHVKFRIFKSSLNFVAFKSSFLTENKSKVVLKKYFFFWLLYLYNVSQNNLSLNEKLYVFSKFLSRPNNSGFYYCEFLLSYIFESLREFLKAEKVVCGDDLLERLEEKSLMSEEIVVYDDEFYELFLTSWFKENGIRSLDGRVESRMESIPVALDNSFLLNDEEIFLSNIFFELSENVNLFSTLEKEMDFFVVDSDFDVFSLDSFLDDNYLFTFSDYAKNMDFFVSLYSHDDSDKFFNAVEKALACWETEQKIFLDKKWVFDEDFIAASHLVFDFGNSLASSYFLEPIWHDFILEESKDRDLDYEMNGSFVVHDAEGSMVDEDFENLVDIVLENFLHNIFSSKYFQRTEFLYDLILREVSFFFLVSEKRKEEEYDDAASFSCNEGQSNFVKQTGQGHNQGMMIGAERSFEEYRELCEVLLKNLHLKDKNNLFDFFDSVLLLEGETHESFIDEEDAFFDFEEDDECSFVLYETVKEEKEEENNECDLSVGDFFFNNFFTFNYIRLIRGLQVGYFNHSTRLEIMWTLIPILIIALIITPSFFFMYAIDEDMEALLTVRVIGHQWFWSYSYSFPSYFYDVSGFNMGVKDLKFFWESKNYSFDAYMLDDTYVGAPRLLATDSILILPKYSHINCVVTSSDVIHSWAIPSLGVKVDAVPGRLNRVDLFIEFEGMFFGQCSELCGVNHAFMPIHVQAVSLSDFLRYMLESF